MTALARTSSNCKRQSSPFVRERARHQQNRNGLIVTKIWPWAQDGGLTTVQTGRVTIGRNTSITLILTVFEGLETLSATQVQQRRMKGLQRIINCKGCGENLIRAANPEFAWRD
jgi:hypothetical protein